jgi:hypothetical protein
MPLTSGGWNTTGGTQLGGSALRGRAGHTPLDGRREDHHTWRGGAPPNWRGN